MASRARGTSSGVELRALVMIGVIANPADHDVVCEFFELFKTPWEFYRPNLKYEVVLVAGDCRFDGTAKVVVLYAGRKTHFDDEHEIRTGGHLDNDCILSYQGRRIPIYGNSITFPEKGSSLLTDEGSQVCAAYVDESSHGALARIGYDLFSEIRTLLTVGQPAANASIPALELHIALLRHLITGAGASIVEIPPIPDGHRFVACLTHDVDHPSIRQHKWDHTMFGFLYRATVGSFGKLFQGRISLRDLVKNCAAALKLPFVHLGLARDFWRDFDDRYLEIENGLHSTFFLIPFSDRPGSGWDGPAPALRGTRYGARSLSEPIAKLINAGCEVGLHGIDAWADSVKGSKELEEIRRLAGASQIGVRMHWLYYNEQSPSTLEAAGATYDSTIGYNETVGYRAGTTQVFKPLNAKELLELPLHVMDTALFYPSYMDFSPNQARVLLCQMIENAVQFGGTLTINWHDRSLAPERLWGSVYQDLLRDLKSRGAWISTVGEAISWFRKRRSATFEADTTQPGAVRVKVSVEHRDGLPGMRLRIHPPQKSRSIGVNDCDEYVDIAVEEAIVMSIPSEVSP